MKVKSHTLTNGKISLIFARFQQLAQLPTIPLKSLIAKNIKKLDDLVADFQEKREVIFKQHVMVDESGDAIIKPKYEEEASRLLKEGRGISYQWYEYEDESKYKAMMIEIDKLANEEHDVEFYAEDFDREIKVSVREDGKTFYEKMTIEDALNDVNNNIASSVVLILQEYMMIEQ